MRAGARLFRTSLSLDDWARFLIVAKPWTTRRGTANVPEDGPQVISAQDVSFTYPGAVAPALDGITLDLKRGEVLAFVGESGAGKTTLARLYLPTAGSVEWDRIDLAEADQASVLSKVALVPQDYTRWPLAARENITLGQPRPEGDTAVHAVIASLPHRLDTSLARSWWGGHDLSGGQWQRITVARAFHRDAPVLVMDEPTAALDACSACDDKVVDALRLFGERGNASDLPADCSCQPPRKVTALDHAVNITGDHHDEARRQLRPALSGRALPGHVPSLLEVISPVTIPTPGQPGGRTGRAGPGAPVGQPSTGRSAYRAGPGGAPADRRAGHDGAPAHLVPGGAGRQPRTPISRRPRPARGLRTADPRWRTASDGLDRTPGGRAPVGQPHLAGPADPAHRAGHGTGCM